MQSAGQEHLLEGLDDLSPSDREAYLAQLGGVDVEYACRAFREALLAEKRPAPQVEPVDDVVTLAVRGRAKRRQGRGGPGMQESYRHHSEWEIVDGHEQSRRRRETRRS